MNAAGRSAERAGGDGADRPGSVDEAGCARIAIAHTTSRCLLVDRAGRIVYANAAARRALPATCDGLDALLERDADRDRIRACLESGARCDVEVPLRARGGSTWHAVSVRPIDAAAVGADGVEGLDGVHGAGNGGSTDESTGRAVAVLSATDVHARRDAEREAWRLAYHDPRTGLPNRIRFLGELERRLLGEDGDGGDDGGNGGPSGLLVIDLDRFGRINDGLGYEVGDAVLAEVARRLVALAGPDALVGRLGGDEFAIVAASGQEPETLARAVLEAMANPLRLAGTRLHVLPSIGVCRCPEHGRSVGDLMAHADVALAAAKRDPRGHRVFDALMGRGIHARLVLENDLVQAVKSGQIEAHYQPRVALADARIVGFEALARWRHPERGLLLPGEFIDVAEETGLIVELGDGIMLEAMAQQRAWARAGHDVTISVNVSARQLAGRDLLATVSENLRRAGCDPTRIELEITESALVGDIDAVARTLGRIAELGVRIAIDDFGTGYSNLAHLARYPLATLKIDRAFVADPAHGALLEAIVAMGRALGLAMVAEGVEHPEQGDRLAARGVEEAQGFLYGRPMPVAEATARLARERPGPGLAAAA